MNLAIVWESHLLYMGWSGDIAMGWLVVGLRIIPRIVTDDRTLWAWFDIGIYQQNMKHSVQSGWIRATFSGCNSSWLLGRFLSMYLFFLVTFWQWKIAPAALQNLQEAVENFELIWFFRYDDSPSAFPARECQHVSTKPKNVIYLNLSIHMFVGCKTVINAHACRFKPIFVSLFPVLVEKTVILWW